PAVYRSRLFVDREPKRGKLLWRLLAQLVADTVDLHYRVGSVQFTFSILKAHISLLCCAGVFGWHICEGGEDVGATGNVCCSSSRTYLEAVRCNINLSRRCHFCGS